MIRARKTTSRPETLKPVGRARRPKTLLIRLLPEFLPDLFPTWGKTRPASACHNQTRGSRRHGRDRTRACDIYDVHVALYRLSLATDSKASLRRSATNPAFLERAWIPPRERQKIQPPLDATGRPCSWQDCSGWARASGMVEGGYRGAAVGRASRRTTAARIAGGVK